MPSPGKTAKTHEIAVFPSKRDQPVFLTMVMLLEILVMVNNTVDRILLIHCEKKEITGSCCFQGGLWMATIFSTLTGTQNAGEILFLNNGKISDAICHQRASEMKY